MTSLEIKGTVLFGYLRGFLLAATSNESGVVDDGNFWRLEWLLLRKLQR